MQYVHHSCLSFLSFLNGIFIIFKRLPIATNCLRPESAPLRHIQAYSEIFSNLCNPGIFTSLPYSEPWCIENQRHIKNIWETSTNQNSLFRHHSAIFRHIHMQKLGISGILEYSELLQNCILMDIYSELVIFTKIRKPWVTLFRTLSYWQF